MINLKKAQITDSLPDIISNQPWAQAISYATSKMFERILTLADASRTFSRIDELNDEVLDILAIDLRVVDYKQTYSTELKRKLVKFALQYWATAGTKAATQEVVSTIFGDATITEWFEYGGTPGCFKILLKDTTLTDKDVLEFKRVAENVKRLSAWLDAIVMEIEESIKIRAGFFVSEFIKETVKQERDGDQFVGFVAQLGIVEKHIMPKGDYNYGNFNPFH